jgi:hypothetical protein
MKHLQLLDLLALLLVMDSQCDITAATTLIARSKGAYDFCNLANGLCCEKLFKKDNVLR